MSIPSDSGRSGAQFTNYAQSALLLFGRIEKQFKLA
jgi:hypothetical protein